MPTISQTERIILLLLSYSKNERQIARRLKLAPDTVENIIAAANRKLTASTDEHAVAKAF